MDDEYLDIVNDEDVIIGRKLRSEVYAENLSTFRVVNAFLINSEGKLWIPMRGPHKKIFPSSLDMSMGGHVESGETYEVSFRRELSEELNINADDVHWRLLGHLTPHKDGVSSFMNVYEIQTDQAPEYNPDDYVSALWLYPEEILDNIKNGESAKSDLPKILEIFYGLGVEKDIQG